jgi:hypothetical protein
MDDFIPLVKTELFSGSEVVAKSKNGSKDLINAQRKRYFDRYSISLKPETYLKDGIKEASKFLNSMTSGSASKLQQSDGRQKAVLSILSLN